MKKGLLIGAAVILLGGGGAAAAVMYPELFGIGPQVTAEILLQGISEKSYDVLDADLTLDMETEMDMSELGTEGSMEFAVSADINVKSNKTNAYANGNVSVKVLGMNQSASIKSYYDDESATSYTYNEKSGTWEYEKKEDSFPVTDAIKKFQKKMNLDVLEDVQMKEHKKGSDYEVTAAICADSIKELAESTGADSSDFGFTGTLDSLNESDAEMDILLVFDEESKEIKAVSFEMELDSDTPGNISAEFKINQAGGELDISIPDDVKESAVEKMEDAGFSQSPVNTGQASGQETPSEDGTSVPDYEKMYGDSQDESDSGSDSASGFMSGSELTGGTSGTIVPDGNTAGNDNTQQMPSSSETVQTPEQGNTADTPVQNPAPASGNGQTGQVSAGNDAFGSFNGKGFGIGFPLSDFTSDGWQKASYSSDNGIFLAYQNAKYPQAEIALYGNKSSITETDLQRSGVYGYKINVMYCDSTKQLPQASFSGLTWGASKEDVIAVYGQPKNTISGPEGVITLQYEANDKTQLSFRINESYSAYADNPVYGLAGVEVINFSLIS